MKKIALILGFCLTMMISCNSNGPTGVAEDDAKQFAHEVFSAYKADNVEKMKETIDTYYEFYKERKENDLRVFFDTWKEQLELYPDDDFDEEKFSEMGQEADKDGKMEKLYQKAR